ncbi:MAG: hypothetical protein BGO98_39835 [Myxococcales bacterium 68-20]|nr:aminotransferase class V-fold PLP-dependent enzyme [Myxococcales bacterium]OJY19256.1 MAG: hypothetical protein BGO98_39835 [Myxococcales bacterium 68-20]
MEDHELDRDAQTGMPPEPRTDDDPFAVPRASETVLAALAAGLREGTVSTASPRYFGHFTTAPSEIALRASAIATEANPQLATRSHAQFAVDVEDLTVRALASRFGYAPATADGTFTSGGAEANAMALALALARAFPEIAQRGLRALAGDPVLYVSNEGHATAARAARLAGLGSDGVRIVPVDRKLRMKPGALGEAIARDRARGAIPFLVVATAGATSAGTIDPIPEIAAIAERAGLWLHLDAAWGGLAAFVPELASVLEGSARADSITFDPHKTLAVPLGAGMLLTRHPRALASAFHEQAGYMPRDASRDPYARSTMWSRRFIGAPTYAVLASLGWSGVAEMLARQVALGDRLRRALGERGWSVVNDTPLPVVCFVDATHEDGARPDRLAAIAREVDARGAGWITLVRFSSGTRVLRACVTSPNTREQDIDALVDSLDSSRKAVFSRSAAP